VEAELPFGGQPVAGMGERFPLRPLEGKAHSLPGEQGQRDDAELHAKRVGAPNRGHVVRPSCPSFASTKGATTARAQQFVRVTARCVRPSRRWLRWPGSRDASSRSPEQSETFSRTSGGAN